MRNIRSTLFLTTFAAALLLVGCGSSGVGDIFGSGRGSDDRYKSVGDVRGTVERVDTLDRRIVVDLEGTGSRNDLRNGDDEVVLYYDSSTRVEYQGQTYRPEDLERGDRILADVERNGDRLVAEDIEVLYDVTGNDRDDRYDRGDRGTRDDDLRAADELRGTVRYVDTRGRTLEIEPSSGYRSDFPTERSGVVLVHYDSGTTVEFEGRRYQPENLERGDVVEIEVRNLSGNRLMAEEILVVSDSRSSR